MSLNHKPFSLEDTIPFGKYAGTKIRVLLFQDISYVVWLIENTDFQLDNAAFEKYESLVAE
jgi:hypothetical protein